MHFGLYYASGRKGKVCSFAATAHPNSQRWLSLPQSPAPTLGPGLSDRLFFVREENCEEERVGAKQETVERKGHGVGTFAKARVRSRFVSSLEYL